MTRDEVKAIQDKVSKVLEIAFGKGAISFEGGTIGDATLTLKVAITPGGEAARMNSAKRDWQTWASRLHVDLKPEHFGQRFMFRGTEYEINGCQPSKPKYAVSAKRLYDGKQFGFTAPHIAREMVKYAVNRSADAALKSRIASLYNASED